MAISVSVEESGVPAETPKSHTPAVSHQQTLSHNFASSTLHHERDSNSQLPYDDNHKGPRA